MLAVGDPLLVELSQYHGIVHEFAGEQRREAFVGLLRQFLILGEDFVEMVLTQLAELLVIDLAVPSAHDLS